MFRNVMPAAVAKAPLQERVIDHRAMKMRSVAGLHAASGRQVTLAAVRCQIMLTDVEHSLVPGTAFVETARFAHVGWITTAASVQSSDAALPAVDHDCRADMLLSGMRSSGRWCVQ